jgi:deoxyadenosine/deoxycytidine kinase
MDDDELGIYAETFGSMKRFLRYPDVLVYLRTDPKVCHERMQRRARSEEGGVPLEYLRRIHEKHESFVEEMSRFTRVLRIDWNHFGSDVEAINERISAVADEDHRFLRDFRRL